MRTASLWPLTVLPQICTVWCTKLRKHFDTIMEVLYCLTVAIGVPGHTSDNTMKTKGRQLQCACKTRWLLREATLRARSDILGVWAALKQLSENKNDAMCIVLLRLMKTKFQRGAFLLSTLPPHLAELSKVFQAGCFNLAQMKAWVELCINKPSDASAKSELEANCEKFDSELGELRLVWLTRVCQVSWRHGRAPKNWQIDHPHTQQGRQD